MAGAATAEVVNSGHIGSAGTAIALAPLSKASVVNSASGVISGTQAISIINAATTQIVNAGSITGGVLNDRVIYLGAGDDAISNSGDIEGARRAIDFTTGSNNSVENSGTISVTGSQAIYGSGDYFGIENSGKISATSNVIDLVGDTGGYDWLVNETGGSISAQSDDYAVLFETDVARIINHGSMNGDVFTNADGSTFVNTGDYNGEVLYNGGNALIRNAGKMSHDGYTGGAASAALAGAASNAPQSSGYNVYIAGNADEDDRLVNAYSGIIDSTGSIAIEHGSAGTFRFINRGDIYGDIDAYGTTSAVNAGVGEIGGDVNFYAAATLFANRGAVDGNVTFTGTGNIYRGYLGFVTGEVFGSGADGRYFGGAGDDTFDMTASGASVVVGGAGDDTFIFTAAGLNASTAIRGGDGDDTLSLSTAGVIGFSAFAQVQTIETIDLAAGTNSLTVPDALASSANGGKLTVNGSTGRDTINVSAVVNPTDTVTIAGGGGPDFITAGGAKDVFAYSRVSDSYSTAFDTLNNVNLGIDRFAISSFASPILAINTAVTTGALSASTFNTDLANALPAAKLGAHDAVLFTPNAGTYSGSTFLVVDVNGTAGYQAAGDLVFRLSGQTGSLTPANFT